MSVGLFAPLRFVGALVAVVGLGGCLLELDRRPACGDGFVDELQDEECDPANEASFKKACEDTMWPEGVGACDSVTCTLIDDRAQCAACGDGLIDFEEECDLGNLGSGVCPDGGPGVTCNRDCTWNFDACEKCGDGVIESEFGEECDPRGGFGTAQACDELATPALPYTSGTTSACQDNCTWDRSTCGYCGNGRRDEERPVAPGVFASELCDGDAFDAQLLAQLEPNEACDADPDLRVNVECGPACNDYSVRDDVPDVCCVVPGAPCPPTTPPGGGETLKCCYEFSHPEEAEFCRDVNTIDEEGQVVSRKVCK